MLTKASGKEEKVESTVFLCKLSNRSFARFSAFSGTLSERLSLRAFGSSSFPCFFSHPSMGGSFPSAQETSTPSNPRSDRPLAHTAANASPICLNGTSAVAFFGGFVGAFFGGFIDSTIDDSSISPKRARRDDTAAGVVRLGCSEREILSLTVVSRWPEMHLIRLGLKVITHRRATYQVAERRPRRRRSDPP